MTSTTRETPTIAELVDAAVDRPLPLRITAYDGSKTGPDSAPRALHIANHRAVSYIATAPGDLGMARAYTTGDLVVEGVHPGDPYDALVDLEELHFRRPDPKLVLDLARVLGLRGLTPPPPPPQEALPRWRRVTEGLRHSFKRDSEAIHHHYDVSNRFYELVLGPSMAYTCAVFPQRDAHLDEAQENKYRLVFDKLGLTASDTLLDIGCGWGGMVRYAARQGVRATGVTLSQEQAEWAQAAIEREGLSDLASVRFDDYRNVTETGFDAISSIGITEHIGVRNYPAYFQWMLDHVKEGGKVLNHCITRPDNRPRSTGAFIDRYIFPDGELTGSGRIITTMQDTGFEVLHEENLREHYALTLTGWNANLVENWDACVAEVGEATAKVWGLYLAGSRRGFERNVVQLHQVLALRLDESRLPQVPLRPWWKS
ncbi:SAM-dependent methyltransferase [Knoellia subterranea]|uniref:Cyclopropane-fatty-acyl-phospholipid synthase n=1 Tax=Knoellia subterranea KCTC 19937 TaxID=1385521 RepID=A0A0A0JN79_9MICO|nr:cyclopropane-fatty-acyl-phospholipid synthase family protein [Knoellia subterranea]KGN38583.1 cyclopropane-fatty-acyl-phospholipid synthase [Knoellia subterranea KCTC 19937]